MNKHEYYIDTEYKDLVYSKENLSKSIILDSKVRNNLTTEEQTDLIIKQLLLLKNDVEVEAYEQKHKDSLNQLMSNITTGEEVFGYLIDSINQINTNLKFHFEKFNSHSTFEELILLREEYKKQNKICGTAIQPTKGNLKFESKYKPFTEGLKRKLLENNTLRSNDRKDVYNKIFDMLRDDIGIIIKKATIKHHDSNEHECHNCKHSDRLFSSDGENDIKISTAAALANTKEDNLDNKNIKYNDNNSYKGDYDSNAINIEHSREPRSMTVDRKKRLNFNLSHRVFSWDKWTYERNLINLKKDINHFIDVKEVPSEPGADNGGNNVLRRGDLLKKIYDICVTMDLDDNTLLRVVNKIKKKEYVDNIIKEQVERAKRAERKINLHASKRNKSSNCDEYNIGNDIVSIKNNFTNRSIKIPSVTNKKARIIKKADNKAIPLIDIREKKIIKLNLNNISNISHKSLNKSQINVKKSLAKSGSNNIITQDKLLNDKYLCFSPKERQHKTPQTKNDTNTFIHSPQSDLRKSQPYLSDTKRRNKKAKDPVTKDNTKDSSLGSFVFTPDYFTNPLTNPFTKHQAQYKSKEVRTKLAKHTPTQEIMYDSILPEHIITNSSKEDGDFKVNIENTLRIPNDESFITVEPSENEKVKVNIPHKTNYLSNSMNREPCDVMLKGSVVYDTLMSPKDTSFVLDPSPIAIQQSPRLEMNSNTVNGKSQFCGVSYIINI
jgi:hypothetical protein